MVKETLKCQSCITVGEACTIICCERNEGHKGNHREHLESTDEETQQHVSVIVEWIAQDNERSEVVEALLKEAEEIKKTLPDPEPEVDALERWLS